LEIRELKVWECDKAAQVVARGMWENPITIAAWRLDNETRQKVLVQFFQSVLRGLLVRGCVLGAFDSETLVGVCAMAPPGQCQPSNGEKVWILSTILMGSNLMVAMRILKWAGEWSRRDPKEAHWHLGPIAVDAHLQGRGIGGLLMTAFCERVDECNARAYLETDKQKNVVFYERYGFRVNAESQVLGVPNWFMIRPSRKEG
jgi:ribosomal protein S18 acetylase RimI-like enzyme